MADKKRKKRKAEVLVSEESIAQQIRRNLDPEARMRRALEPTRQTEPPQYGPSGQAQEDEQY